MSQQPHGRCRYCGCTEFDPCFVRMPSAFYPDVGDLVPCHWMNPIRQTVCSMPMCQALGIIEGEILDSPENVQFTLACVRNQLLRAGVAEVSL